MIYNLLTSYKEYLLEKFKSETANTYYKKLCLLFEGQSLSRTVERLDVELLLKKLEEIRYKNYFSQSKSAFLYFCKFQNITLSPATLERIKEIGQVKKKKYRRMAVVDFKQVEQKIKRIRNKKLKLSYQVMLTTGLRVSELASITADACTITEDNIIFSIIGKGGDKQTVSISAYEYPTLYEHLKNQIETTSSNKKLFYSVIYLQTKATELGFKCLDLRRAFAKIEYKKCGSKKDVMKKLRHSSLKPTNIYIRSRIKL